MKSIRVTLIVLSVLFLISLSLSAGTVRYSVVAQIEYVYQSVLTEFYVVEEWEDGVWLASMLIRIDGDYLMFYGDLIGGSPVFESEPIVVEKVVNITPGDTWTANLGDIPMYEVAVGEVQKTVPAGTFTAMEIDLWDDNNRSVFVGKRWLAEGVGLLGFEGEYLGVTAYERLTSYTYVGGSDYWPMAVGNELVFETGESMQVVEAPYATITIDGDPSEWAPYDPAVEDPEGDDPSAYDGVDIRELYIAYDDVNLYMMFSFWDGGPSTLWGGSRFGAYQVYVMPDDDESEEIGWISYYYGGDFWFLSPLNFDFDGTVTACGEVMECSIPLASLGNPSSLYRYSLSVGDMEENYDKSNMVGVNLGPPDTLCCEGRVGDANGLGGDEPTVGDVAVLIDAKFITMSCDGMLECLTEADLNQSGGADPTCDDITVGDIAILIDYLFITGPTLGLPDCL